LEINRDVIPRCSTLAVARPSLGKSAIEITGTFGIDVQPLVGQFKLDKELEKLFKSMPEFSKPENGGAESATG